MLRTDKTRYIADIAGDDDPDQQPAPPAMELTLDLVKRTLRPEPDHGPEPGWTTLSEEELDQLAQHYADKCGGDQLWVFAYGSLIWKPDFDAIDHMRATAYGWHRAFCLKINRFRGSPSQYGLMMALKAGGSCDGVIYRLPDRQKKAQIRRMLVREILYHQNLDMIRWIHVHTDSGKKRVMVFWAGPTDERVIQNMSLKQVAAVLARACGPMGSCAEYLYNTVRHLHEFGINDRNLWTLQALVADEIRSLTQGQ